MLRMGSAEECSFDGNSGGRVSTMFKQSEKALHARFQWDSVPYPGICGGICADVELKGVFFQSLVKQSEALRGRTLTRDNQGDGVKTRSYLKDWRPR